MSGSAEVSKAESLIFWQCLKQGVRFSGSVCDYSIESPCLVQRLSKKRVRFSGSSRASTFCLWLSFSGCAVSIVQGLCLQHWAFMSVQPYNMHIKYEEQTSGTILLCVVPISHLSQQLCEDLRNGMNPSDATPTKAHRINTTPFGGITGKLCDGVVGSSVFTRLSASKVCGERTAMKLGKKKAPFIVLSSFLKDAPVLKSATVDHILESYKHSMFTPTIRCNP